MRKTIAIFAAIMFAHTLYAAVPAPRVAGATNVPRTATTAPRTQTITAPRSAITPRVAAPVSVRSAVTAPRTAVSRATGTAPVSARAAVRTPTARTQNARSATISRAATLSGTGASISGTYSNCRTVYFGCMDEFCANKDAQLKRCACSSRAHEFDGMRANLDTVESQMLDFNERLLTVSMNAEDARAISQATAGEIAYAAGDESASKKMLDQIMSKIKSTADENNEIRNLGAITLGLDFANAWDNIDASLGTAESAKSGTALYRAAIPICQSMAVEVCDENEIEMVQSAYLMTIEQDCNTVAKTYMGVSDMALEKVREGAALLDISRLQNHQTRNSDNILVCKKKMMDALAGPSVCGDDFSRCLDWTGRYIDPSTGGAILSADLGKLSDLIKRPTEGHTWAGTADNKRFVDFLGTKRKYIESAMENCEGKVDDLWNIFVEDALPKIHLAARDKLQEIRTSCTELTAGCASGAMKSLEDFDVRALSVFAVRADRTANEICADTRNACIALLNTGGDEWATGIQDAADRKTLDTALYACKIIGQNCIIENCSDAAGKFGACRVGSTNTARAEILNTQRCWGEVADCIRDIDPAAIGRIVGALGTPVAGWPVDDHRADGITGNLFNLTKHIWGSCTGNPNPDAESNIEPEINPGDNLMAWMAGNTNSWSCSANMLCMPGQQQNPDGECRPSGEFVQLPPDNKIYWCGNMATHMCTDEARTCTDIQINYDGRPIVFTGDSSWYIPRLTRPDMLPSQAQECKPEQEFININNHNYWCGAENHLCDDGKTCARAVSGDTLAYVPETDFATAQTWFRPTPGTDTGICLPADEFRQFADGVYWCDASDPYLCTDPDQTCWYAAVPGDTYNKNLSGKCKPIAEFTGPNGEWCDADENILECDGGVCKTGNSKNLAEECKPDDQFVDCTDEHPGCINGKTWCDPTPLDNGNLPRCENSTCPNGYELDMPSPGCVPI